MKRIIKTNDESGFNTVLFVALVPDEIDRNGDKITQEEITKTAYEFMKNLHKKKVNIDHKKNTDVSDTVFVESYVLPFDMNVDDDVIPKGSWMIGIQFEKEMYEEILAGEYIGISIEGMGERKEID